MNRNRNRHSEKNWKYYATDMVFSPKLLCMLACLPHRRRICPVIADFYECDDIGKLYGKHCKHH